MSRKLVLHPSPLFSVLANIETVNVSCYSIRKFVTVFIFRYNTVTGIKLNMMFAMSVAIMASISFLYLCFTLPVVDLTKGIKSGTVGDLPVPRRLLASTLHGLMYQ